MKTTILKFLLLTFLLSTALPSDRDVNPPAFAQPFFTGISEKNSSNASSAGSSDNTIINPPPKLAPGYDKSRVVKKVNPVLVKNISVSPKEVTNDGNGYVEIRCSVFTPNDNAHIESVKLMLSQGIHNLEPILLIPDMENILSPSAEGDYIGRIWTAPDLQETPFLERMELWKHEQDSSDDDIGDVGDADDTGDTGGYEWEFESDEEDYQDVNIPEPGDSEGEDAKEE